MRQQIRWVFGLRMLALAPAWAAGGMGQGMTPLPDRTPAPEIDLVDLDGQRHTLA